MSYRHVADGLNTEKGLGMVNKAVWVKDITTWFFGKSKRTL